MRKLIASLENVPISFYEWLLGSAGIIFIRLFLENLSSPASSGFLTSGLVAMSHFLLFFWCLMITIILILHLYSKESIVKITRLAVFGLIVIWIPPIVDLLIYAGRGSQLAYIMTKSAWALVALFFLYFGPLTHSGISIGLRTEILLILVVIFWYLLNKTRSYSRASYGTLISYLAIYIWLSFPSVIMLIFGLVGSVNNYDSVNGFLTDNIQSSIIAKNIYNNSFTMSSNRANEIFAVAAVNDLMMIAIFLLAFFWLFIYDKKKLIATFKNSRFSRIGHYFIFIIIGLILAGKANVYINWTYWISLIVLFLSFYSAWMFAVGTNDIEDIEIDKISNPGRPLIKNNVDIVETKNMNVFFLAYSLLGAALIGEYILLFIIVYTFAYYIYSAKPLKLKRIPIISTFLISIATLCATMAGFFFNSSATNFSDFPFKYAVLILVGITLGATVKDLKDIEGDGANGIRTLPVLLKNSPLRYLFAFLWAFAFFSLPFLIFKNLLHIIPIAPFALTALYIIRYKFQESYIFALYFLFMLITILIQSQYLFE